MGTCDNICAYFTPFSFSSLCVSLYLFKGGEGEGVEPSQQRLKIIFCLNYQSIAEKRKEKVKRMKEKNKIELSNLFP
jgi:hypothetical protein